MTKSRPPLDIEGGVWQIEKCSKIQNQDWLSTVGDPVLVIRVPLSPSLHCRPPDGKGDFLTNVWLRDSGVPSKGPLSAIPNVSNQNLTGFSATWTYDGLQPIRDIQGHGLVHLFTRTTSATNCCGNMQNEWLTLHWTRGLVLTGAGGRV